VDKMLDFLRSIFREYFSAARRPSRVIAKNRLTVVLVQDRAGLSPKELERFKSELLSVLERYFVIDAGGLDLEYKRQGECTILSISSPVIVKRDNSQAGSNEQTETQDASEKSSESLKLEIELEKDPKPARSKEYQRAGNEKV
jgi:cell division topological specificity factor